MATTPTATKVVSIAAESGTVWLLPLDTVSEAELLTRAHLTAAELIVFGRFAPEQQQRRKEWLAGRVLAWEQLGARIGYEPSGRPVLLANDSGAILPDLHISISHTAGWAAVMAADGAAGLDIELISRNAERVAGRIAIEDEIALVASVFPENPALLGWCAKEAAYKALGHEGMDFRKHIHIQKAAAQTLLVTVGTGRITLEFFRLKDLIGVCGKVQIKTEKHCNLALQANH